MKLEQISLGQLSIINNGADTPEQTQNKIEQELAQKVSPISLAEASSDADEQSPSEDARHSNKAEVNENKQQLSNEKLGQLLELIEQAKHKKNMQSLIKQLENQKIIKAYSKFVEPKEYKAVNYKKAA